MSEESTLNTKNKHNFENNILELSKEQNNINLALLEWEIFAIISGIKNNYGVMIKSELCICNKRIGNLIIMFNKINGKSFTIGRDCYNKWFEGEMRVNQKKKSIEKKIKDGVGEPIFIAHNPNKFNIYRAIKYCKNYKTFDIPILYNLISLKYKNYEDIIKKILKDEFEFFLKNRDNFKREFLKKVNQNQNNEFYDFICNNIIKLYIEYKSGLEIDCGDIPIVIELNNSYITKNSKLWFLNEERPECCLENIDSFYNVENNYNFIDKIFHNQSQFKIAYENKNNEIKCCNLDNIIQKCKNKDNKQAYFNYFFSKLKGCLIITLNNNKPMKRHNTNTNELKSVKKTKIS